MRTVIVDDAETPAQARARLAGDALRSTLELLRTEASGLVVEAAASGTLPPRQHPRGVYGSADDERTRDLARTH